MRTCVLRLDCFLLACRLTVPLPALPDVHLSVQREVHVKPPVRLQLGERGHFRLRHTPHIYCVIGVREVDDDPEDELVKPGTTIGTKFQNPVFNEMWFLSIDPFVGIPVFIAKAFRTTILLACSVKGLT